MRFVVVAKGILPHVKLRVCIAQVVEGLVTFGVQPYGFLEMEYGIFSLQLLLQGISEQDMERIAFRVEFDCLSETVQ